MYSNYPSNGNIFGILQLLDLDEMFFCKEYADTLKGKCD